MHQQNFEYDNYGPTSDLIFSYRNSSSLDPEYCETRLYDKAEDNIELIDSGKVVKILTMNGILLGEVKQILASSTELYKINPGDIPPNDILDGSENSFFFRSDVHKIRINGCNLWVWYNPERYKLKPTKAVEILMQTREEIAKRLYKCGVDKKYLSLE